MSIFTTIGRDSQRGYQALQLLFASSAGTLAWSMASFGDGGRLSLALCFCLAVNLAALSLTVYVQRAMSNRLRLASVDDEERARIMSTDALTGAMTRRAFLEELRQSLGRPLAPKPATLVLVDLDHFKQLNDSFGHPFGDTVLTHLVKTIASLFPDGAIGRLGGDEFAILLRYTEMDQIAGRARALEEALRTGIQFEQSVVTLSASIGVAIAPQHATRAKELMLLADLALYESKANGRGRFTVFDTGLLSDRRHRRLVERELRAAIYLNELELHYQPVLNADGSIYAVEGLVRWRHSVRGMISPAEFVPIAEESNLIDTLGAWVFRRACLDIDAFPGARISVNVSGEQLKRDEFVDMLARVLRETGRTAERFVLEITETAATAATPEILRRIEIARAMGFRIALDDFGTGFCGFNYLKSLPIDAIKIDRSYVQSLANDEVARIFVSALTQIARIQDLVIVAEGIETEHELTLARAAGCNRFQGFYLGRPEPKERLRELFAMPANRSTAIAV